MVPSALALEYSVLSFPELTIRIRRFVNCCGLGSFCSAAVIDAGLGVCTRSRTRGGRGPKKTEMGTPPNPQLTRFSDASQSCLVPNKKSGQELRGAGPRNSCPFVHPSHFEQARALLKRNKPRHPSQALLANYRYDWSRLRMRTKSSFSGINFVPEHTTTPFQSLLHYTTPRRTSQPRRSLHCHPSPGDYSLPFVRYRHLRL